MEIYRAKSPLRVSFSGGGTDIEPYLIDYGGCVLSTTINKYCYATLIPRDDNQVIIHSHDFNLTVKYQLDEKDSLEDDLKLVRAVIRRLDVRQGFEIKIHSDAPVGSGLGSSSSLVVCLIGVLSKWMNLSLSLYDISRMAYEIERVDMNISGGHQDQYASAFGGFNFIEFFDNKTIVNPLRIKESYLNELEYNLLLCFTGKTRMGESIIKKQVSSYKDNVQYLHELKSLTLDMKNSLLTGNVHEFGSLFHDAWENKRKLTSGISNPHIDELYEIGRNAGALGGKLLGAGGGGYLLFYCTDKQKVGKALQDAGGQLVDFNFDYKGLTTWKI
jgi:D-glycero-alpha-D-manno-heptose-7-phosphate kinase